MSNRNRIRSPCAGTLCSPFWKVLPGKPFPKASPDCKMHFLAQKIKKSFDKPYLPDYVQPNFSVRYVSGRVFISGLFY
jgi:hypothetical protein